MKIKQLIKYLQDSNLDENTEVRMGIEGTYDDIEDIQYYIIDNQSFIYLIGKFSNI